MNNLSTIILSATAGAVLGVIFFGGLWCTVQRGMKSSRPATWFVGSAVLRMSVVVFGFYFVGGSDLKRMAACLVGFILVRIAVLRFTRVPVENREEARDES